MKKLLFVIPTLSCGGAERGLTALLKKLDYSKYDVDLLLFRKDDMYYLGEIPKEVNILNNDLEMQLAFFHVKHLLKPKFIFKYPHKVLLRIYLTIRLKMKSILKLKKEYYEWDKLKKIVPKNNENYDCAIGFLEGNATFYVIDKVHSTKKIGWMRSDYEKWGYQKKHDLVLFEKLDTLFSVSDANAEALRNIFPEIKNKIKVMYNVLDEEEISKKAASNDAPTFDKKCFNILSVGNLRYVKGYDIAIDVCKRLRDEGYDFTWYIAGEGRERKMLEKIIRKYSLEKHFILLGLCKNPYKLLKECDLYVQTSRHEGFSTTIREAKIFTKPIVVTDVPGMRDQIINNYTGLIAELSVEKIFVAIKSLIDNKDLLDELQQNISIENSKTFFQNEQMNQFYGEL